ncbi:MAG: AAA family ATPase [Alphaproteobacteria bacterium]|nr:AAA family ATPase [Alphaproteobacteria bacterium]
MPVMYVQEVHLFHYRNIENKKYSFDRDFSLFYGENGVGKTNLLEAVSFLSQGNGFRKTKLEEIGYHKGGQFLPWSVSGKVVYKDISFEIKTHYDKTKTSLRESFIDCKKVAQKELAERIRFVILTPTMDKVFTEGSQSTRRLIDSMIRVFDPAHKERMMKYDQLLKERYALCEKEVCSAWLGVNARLLAEQGVAIAVARMDYIRRINIILEGNQTYFPSVSLRCEGMIEKELETKSALDVEDLYESYLKKNIGYTTVDGAHRSQFMLYHQEKKLPANLCSTGEQKTMLLSLLLGQIKLLESILGETPVFLLDEAGAHLDLKNQTALLEELKGLQVQTIMTNVTGDLFQSEKMQRVQVG